MSCGVHTVKMLEPQALASSCPATSLFIIKSHSTGHVEHVLQKWDIRDTYSHEKNVCTDSVFHKPCSVLWKPLAHSVSDWWTLTFTQQTTKKKQVFVSVLVRHPGKYSCILGRISTTNYMWAGWSSWTGWSLCVNMRNQFGSICWCAVLLQHTQTFL